MKTFEQFAKELLGSFFISLALNQDIKHGAILIDRSPKRASLPIDGQKHLIKMPLVSSVTTSMFELIGVDLAKCEAHLVGKEREKEQV
ncbi:hypothetical protein KSC_073140 [Ktedonobacter sp. SOSP1-52]|nr:hypothetical protein KSC_073140 [Ktedonobacter sp. SOSP1-52]